MYKKTAQYTNIHNKKALISMTMKEFQTFVTTKKITELDKK